MLYSIIGWTGVIVFIIAYLLLSIDVLNAKKPTYHWLNVLGAICLVINSYSTTDYPSIAVNGIWGLIALATIIKILWMRKLK